ncbi:MAG TPA: hypothetical protein VFY68_15930 [Nitrososphaeraceae archaeon]|nr:hypothetical protein [Nitrososphaeraceae archaeon]
MIVSPKVTVPSWNVAIKNIEKYLHYLHYLHHNLFRAQIGLKSVEILFNAICKTSTRDNNLHQFGRLDLIGGDTLTRSGDTALQYIHRKKLKLGFF